MKTLFEKFKVLEDPRDIRGKKYKLIDILIMTIYGILCGLTDFTNIADFLKLKEEYFKQLLNLEYGTPSHDCLSDVFAVIDSKKFMEIFVEWTKEIVKKKTNKNISIDGKAIKSATNFIKGGNTPYIVSAFLGDIGISIGQVKVEEKREYYLSYDVNTIRDKKKWDTVKAIAFVRVERTIGDETSITDNYFIVDYKIEIDKLEEVIRDHWNIECGLHWRLDVILDEDHSRNRIGNSINNLSIVRKIAFNLANLDTSFGNKKMPLQRKLTRYMLDFSNIERLIFEIIPNIS